jgi:hypothetical protein
MKAFVDLPVRMLRLPRDERGYPVPRFVEWINGKPDFRIMSRQHMSAAIRRKLCWICGQPLGRWKSFVIGPMCSVNRISAEPPSHHSCATFAAKNCPFLTHPQRKRDDRDLPEFDKPAGVMLEHNPGVTLVWTTDDYKIQNSGGGPLFKIGEAHTVEWWAHGRTATRAEVLASFDKGLPHLRGLAEQDGRAALADLDKQLTKAMQLVPQEAA